MIKKISIATIILVLVVITMTGCIPGDGTATAAHKAGFFWGIWHGWIAPISLIVGLFDHNISIYETYNTGWLYDLGFYAAIISGFGGFSFSRRKRKNDH
ncbi:MAG TPA: hypothetical protein DF480_03340 [Clostridiales bacterium]|nr:hypothetical protein [Clostridiales bacterium]